MNRRNLLKAFTGLCFPLYQPASAAETHWDYKGDDPQHWSELSAEYQSCSAGVSQSPINLDHGIKASLPQLEIDYGDNFTSVENNGHTVLVTAGKGNQLVVDGERYNLVQCHFHHPSEHLLKGARFPLECHFVHRLPDDEIAVIGVLMKEGRRNDVFEQILRLAPKTPGKMAEIPGGHLAIKNLLPATFHYIRYSGSLTTPPCSEAVNWMVLIEPVEISAEQIARFAALYPDNARPIQPLHHRPILED
ncbi:carbonate dehydratase [Phyllobacterium phragmitis]|uniref:carbonic anhydrase n=1 Tax=Phyllobacterium phragmitis TaxID=2670329 RepID=A0A2S9IKV3_9HYPH|nr:carbonic anhydrase family protein [Phyllobacterium phragmitis]PRD41138.1 carbonate dehydratase [Phyllobacterium phragmitis]